MRVDTIPYFEQALVFAALRDNTRRRCICQRMYDTGFTSVARADQFLRSHYDWAPSELDETSFRRCYDHWAFGQPYSDASDKPTAIVARVRWLVEQHCPATIHYPELLLRDLYPGRTTPEWPVAGGRAYVTGPETKWGTFKILGTTQIEPSDRVVADRDSWEDEHAALSSSESWLFTDYPDPDNLQVLADRRKANLRAFFDQHEGEPIHANGRQTRDGFTHYDSSWLADRERSIEEDVLSRLSREATLFGGWALTAKTKHQARRRTVYGLLQRLGRDPHSPDVVTWIKRVGLEEAHRLLQRAYATPEGRLANTHS